ncbi:MAG: hypothetical protein ACRDLD_02445 [Thermoleophilaceae bacterium]
MPRDRRRKPSRNRRPSRTRNRRSRRDQGYFTKPLTRKRFKREMKAAERMEFRPEKQAIRREARAERGQRERISDYFDAYGEATQGANRATQSAYENAQKTLRDLTASSTASDTATRAKADAEARADAKARGVTYDPSQSQKSAAGSSSRRAASDTFGGLVATQGAGQAAYLIDKGRVGEGERVNQLLRSHARSRTIKKDKRALAREKRDYRRDYRTRARDTERQYLLEQMALTGDARGDKTQLKLARRYGLNTKREQKRSLKGQRKVAKLHARNRAAEQRRSHRSQAAISAGHARNERRDDRRSRRYAQRQGQGQGRGGRGPSKGEVRRALGYLRQANRGDYRSKREAIDYLINRGVSPSAARAAVRRAAGGGGGGRDVTANAALND